MSLGDIYYMPFYCLYGILDTIYIVHKISDIEYKIFYLIFNISYMIYRIFDIVYKDTSYAKYKIYSSLYTKYKISNISY